MKTTKQWSQENHARWLRQFYRTTWAHILRFKSIKARRDGHCPKCKGDIVVGDYIAMPYKKNQAGGNLYSNCWYCFDCATGFQLEAIEEYWTE